MLRAVQLLLFYALLSWLGSMLLLGNLACLPLIVVPRTVREPVLQAAISRTFQLFLQGCSTCGLMRLELEALDKLAHDRGVVLVANHPSMIDVFLVTSWMCRWCQTSKAWP